MPDVIEMERKVATNIVSGMEYVYLGMKEQISRCLELYQAQGQQAIAEG